MLAIPSDDYRLQIYDAKTAEQLDEYDFGSPIVVAEFIGDGSRLLVLTRDQTAFVMKPQAHKADTNIAVAE